LKTITKKLERAQCNDREIVLYAPGRLEGLASDWWDAYTAAHPAPNTITWQQFRDAFHAHHIPDGVLKLKQREFLALKQGNMSVNEYLDKFTKLSRYAPDEVNTDPKRQERFLDGLIGPLNYQLESHNFPDFATLLNKAIGLENKRRELGEQKRKFQSQGQSSSHTRPRYSFQQNSPFRFGGQGGKHPQNMQLQRSFQQPQRFNPQTPRTPNFQQNRPALTPSAPVRNNTLCSLMDASSGASWDIMLITVINAGCRLPRGVMFRKLDSHQLQRAPEMQALQAIKHNRTMCAARCTT
jgi:hypothetical protein